MILEGAFTIPAHPQRVWDAIWDVDTMARLVPGCKTAEQVDDTTYRVHLEQQISMLKASFDLVLTVSEREAPSHVLLLGRGEDRLMGSSIQLQSAIDLSPADADATIMRYRHDLSVFGRLGAIGFPLIQRKARDAEAEFVRRAQQLLGGV